MPASVDSAPRQDAVRNRRRILTAARLMSDEGRALGLNAVADRAGVGVGTVYRHFPDPESLRVGLAEQRLEELQQRADDLADADDPREALRTFLVAAVRIHAADRDFAAVFGAHPSARADVQALREALASTTTGLIDRAAAQLRPGLDARDLLHLACGVGVAVGLRPERAVTYLDLFLDAVLPPS